MSGSSSGANQTMIPPTLEWVQDGRPTPAFYALILSLFNRTGGAASPSGGDAIGLQYLQHEIDTLTVEVQTIADDSLLGALMGDDGAVVPQAAATDSDGEALAAMGDASPPPSIDQAVFMGQLLGDGSSGTGGSSPSPSPSAVYAPLVNGDLPGPTLIATPDGQCVMVPIT